MKKKYSEIGRIKARSTKVLAGICLMCWPVGCHNDSQKVSEIDPPKPSEIEVSNTLEIETQKPLETPSPKTSSVASKQLRGKRVESHGPIAETQVEQVGGLLSPFYRGQLRWSLDTINVAFSPVPEARAESLPPALKFDLLENRRLSPFTIGNWAIWGFFELLTQGKFEEGKRYAIGTSFTVDVLPGFDGKNWKAKLKTALVCQKQVPEGKFEDTFVTGEQSAAIEFPASKTVTPGEPSLQIPNPLPVVTITLPKEQRVTLTNPPHSGIVTLADCPDRIKIQIWADGTPHFTLRALDFSIFEVTEEF